MQKGCALKVLYIIVLTRVWFCLCLQAVRALMDGGSNDQPLLAEQSNDSVSGPDTHPAFSATAADTSVPSWQTAGGQDWSGRSSGGLFASGNSSTGSCSSWQY